MSTSTNHHPLPLDTSQTTLDPAPRPSRSLCTSVPWAMFVCSLHGAWSVECALDLVTSGCINESMTEAHGAGAVLMVCVHRCVLCGAISGVRRPFSSLWDALMSVERHGCAVRKYDYGLIGPAARGWSDRQFLGWAPGQRACVGTSLRLPQAGVRDGHSASPVRGGLRCPERSIDHQVEE